MLPRRAFCALLAGWPFAGLAAEMAERKLDFRIGEGFTGARPNDIEAVVRSAGTSIWKHCPGARWQVPGFFVYYREAGPITIDQHRADGRIAIGLSANATRWAQFAFQFAHEFCHALAGHCNEWQKVPARRRGLNLWIEESLCETASLFALRAMATSWKTSPPYPNWKSYASNLATYAQDRLNSVKLDGAPFKEWLAREMEGLRRDAVQREKNLLIASQLLPLFEAQSAGWEALCYCNLGGRVADCSLAEYFDDWTTQAPAAQRDFISKVAALLR